MNIQKLSVKQIDDMIMWRMDANVYMPKRTTTKGFDFDERIEEAIKNCRLTSEEKSVIRMKAHMKANEYEFNQSDALLGSSANLPIISQKAADAGVSYAFELGISFMLAHNRHERHEKFAACALLSLDIMIGVMALTASRFSVHKILLLSIFAFSIYLVTRLARTDIFQSVSGFATSYSVFVGALFGAGPILYLNMFK